jgi:adenosylcobinamide-GDP ribazoletransferase
MIRNELNIFLAAISFFTRIRIRIPDSCNSLHFNQAVRYLPWLGFLIGASSALVFWSTMLLFPQPIAVLLAMLVPVLITGAFHEDGLADVFDGFGGGYSRERILEIMKDSHIGTFGVVSLIFVLLFRYILLLNMPVPLTPFTLILGHSLSRFFILPTMHWLPYARNNTTSKAKPVIKIVSWMDLLFGFIPVFLAFIVMLKVIFVLILVPLIIASIWMSVFFNKKIRGYTGDCLGAIQQITEIVLYLSLLACLKVF